MIDKILIINGVDNTDDISYLGLEVAERYQEADRIFIISKEGMPMQVKYGNDENVSRLYYIDANLFKDDTGAGK